MRQCELRFRQRSARLDGAAEEGRVAADQELGPARCAAVGAHEQRRVPLDVVVRAAALGARLVPLDVAFERPIDHGRDARDRVRQGGEERLRLGTMVSPTSFRHPSVLSKSVVTADHVSGGRVRPR